MSRSENVNVTVLTCGPWYVIGIYDLTGIQGKQAERQHFELNNKCKRAWPTNNNYWSATANGSNYFNVNLNNGNVNSNDASNTNYASCVSGQHIAFGVILSKRSPFFIVK